MKRGLVVFMLFLAFIGIMADSAIAQRRSTASPRMRRGGRPTTSPYLNLLGRGSRNIGSEYFRRIRPEIEFREEYHQTRNALNRIQNQVDRQQFEIRRNRASQLTTSGHVTRFLDLGSYYRSPRNGR